MHTIIRSLSRVDQLPITKISYRVNSSKEASMRIIRGNDSLNLIGAIQRGTPEAEEMFKKMEMTIEARNDVNQARKITSAGIEGLAECKASTSNLRRIQVKDIVKEVEDHLKTYSSVRMNISWYVEGIRGGSKESRRWQNSDYPVTL
ncbi:hypothetical protein Tco_0987196 [Tanacetum coccineum]